MRAERGSHFASVSMALLMFVSTLIMGINPLDSTNLAIDENAKNTGLNQDTSMMVYSNNGSSSSLKAEVPNGHTVESIDLALEPDVLAYNDGITLSGISDWDANGAILDRIDVNQTDGMQLLPQEWSWDFENANHGWTLQSSGGWSWGFDSTLGSSNGVHSGTKALYTYNGNYPNYMSTTYWATSPAVDCSSCSGSWTLSYWKRLGVEYHYYDHAYVQIKNAQGNWVQIYSSSGTINDGSYNLVNHNIGTYAQNNPSLQVRFGLGTTDGSVTYTGWNLDDVSISPAQGAGGGEQANWTSARFGPEISGAYHTKGLTYGIASIDATVPNGAALSLSVLDGVSKTPIPGFSMIESTWVDLGTINPELHPSLRIRLNLDIRNGGTSPIVHAVHLNHRYATTFNSNPEVAGSDDIASDNPSWTLNSMSWTGNSVSGSGSMVSPLFTSHRPIAELGVTVSASGSWTTEVSLDGGSWQSISNSGIQAFEDYGNTIQVRLSCSGSCTFNDVRFDIIGGHLPTDPAFDIGLDGWNEWELNHPHISSWGWQNRLTNGELSTDLHWTIAATRQVGVLLPKSGLEYFSVDFAAISTCEPLSVSFSVAGQPIYTKSVILTTGVEKVVLSDSELNAFNENLSNAANYWGAPGGLEYAFSTVDIDGTFGSVRVGGVSAIYRPSIDFSFDTDSSFVLSMNQALIDAPLQSQNRLVPLALTSSTPGGAVGKITDIVTSENVLLDGYTITNFTTTSPLTPSWQWMELEARYSWGTGTAEYLVADVETDNIRTIYRFDVDGSGFEILDALMNPSEFAESPLIFTDSNGGAFFEQSSDGLNVSLPFQTNASLDDSDSFEISFSLYMADGAPSPAIVERVGIGTTQGIENDIILLNWDVYNNVGSAIPQSMSYLQSNSPIVIEAKLGFEGLIDPSKNPRSGDVRVHLLENGVLKTNTTTLEQGVVSFPISTPMGTGDVTYTVEVEPLSGQVFSTTLSMNRTFTVDSMNPQVIDQNIARYDHRTPSPNQLIRIEVFDRPVLPTGLDMMVWREWVDDTNGDGVMDSDEYTAMPMQPPSNLSMSNGNYSLVIDDSGADDGDLVTGYLTGSDPAGNEVIGAGEFGSEKHLFMYQVLPDGPPSLPAEGGFVGAPDGRLSYLHPGVDYSFSLHIVEPNGWSDIDNLRMQLASNSVSDNLAIEWSAEDGLCDVQSEHMVVSNCGVRAWSGRLSPFNPDLEFYVDFKLNWTLPSEGDMRWEPSIEVTDRSGQGAWLSLPQLRWRFSPDLAIDTDSLILNIGSGTYSEEGAWVSPTSPISLQGMVHFPESESYPSSPFTLRVLLDGQESILQSENGFWSVTVSAPSTSGSYPLTVELVDLPTGANDITSSSDQRIWIVVDPTGPEPIEVISPRADSPIPIESLDEVQIELKISELEQIDESSVQLHWKIVRGPDARVTPLALGNVDMVIQGGNLAGQSIITIANLDLGDAIPEEFHTDELYLHIWVTGQDMAGNSMLLPGGTNHDENPFASWRIKGPEAELKLEDSVTYSRSGDVSEGQNIMITISIRNDGEVPGTALIRLTEMHLDESRNRELTAVPIEIFVSPGNRTLHYIDWEPSEEGRQWIQVTMEGGTVVNGPTLNVVEAEESSFLASVFDGVNIVWTILFIGLMILLGSVIMIALRSGGSSESALHGTDDMWDEDGPYDYFEENNMDVPDPTPPPTPAVVVPTTIIAPPEFPLDYTDDTVKYVIEQHKIHDVNGFLLYAKDFDADNNGYLKQGELEQAAKSFVALGTQAQPTSSGPPAPIDLANMTPEQMVWYEQAKKWGGYYDEAGNWIPI